MTKLLFLTLAALVTTSSAASAAGPTTGAREGVLYGDIFDRGSNDDAHVDFGRVEAPAAGVIEVFDYRRGRMGHLVAREAVDAGTNWRVRLNLGMPQRNDLIAVLKVDGQVVDQRVIGDAD